MQNILTAPQYENFEGPSIFLAGPIRGAEDWQSQAIAHLKDKTSAMIVSPRRPDATDEDFGPEEYVNQIKWEHYFLDKAAKNGVIMFWLAKELKYVPGISYAQTSRFELGEAVMWHVYQGVKVVIGMEEGFTNSMYLRYTIKEQTPDIPLLDSLKETCEAAVRLLSK